MKRVFLAIPIHSQKTLELLQNVQSELQQQPPIARRVFRWNTPEKFHITVTFIGNVNDEKLQQLMELLRTIHVPKTEISFKNLQQFSNPARVICAVAERNPDLEELKKTLDERLIMNGFSIRLLKNFTPHVTLALRAQAISPVKLRHYELNSSFVMQQMVLFESTLTPDGALYKPILTRPATDS